MDIIDNTAKSPISYRVRQRKPEEITSITIHAMGLNWTNSNPMYARVKAHFVVRQDGSVLMNHHPLTRLRYGSEVYGVHPATPEQVAASRALIASLCEQYPSIQFVSSHRHISAGKSSCPGPLLWREVGEYAIQNLGLHEAPVLKGGLALSEAWRGSPIM